MADDPSKRDPFAATRLRHEATDVPTLRAPASPYDVASPEQRVGQEIAGRYRLVRLLGSGGMGDVYLAEHMALQHQVAIKYMRPALAADVQNSSRFLREAQALSMLKHPHIVKVHDFGASAQEMFLVMEHLEGQPLSRWLVEAGSLPSLEDVGEVLDQLLDALATAHQAGILHRDLKPDNLFFTRLDGRPWITLLDFGLAHIDPALDRVGKLTTTGVAGGTPLYMSPEQCRSLTVEAPSDLYSVGCLMTELLQGKPPFEGTSAAELMAYHMYMPVTPLQRPVEAPPVPPLLEALRRSLLAKRPEQRPTSARATRERLAEALDAGRARQILPDRTGHEQTGRAQRAPAWERPEPPAPAPAASQGARVGWWSLARQRCPEDLKLGLASQGLELIEVGSRDEVTAHGVSMLVLAGGDEATTLATLQALREGAPERAIVALCPSLDMGAIHRLVAAGAADVMQGTATAEALGRKLTRLRKRRTASP